MHCIRKRYCGGSGRKLCSLLDCRSVIPQYTKSQHLLEKSIVCIVRAWLVEDNTTRVVIVIGQRLAWHGRRRDVCPGEIAFRPEESEVEEEERGKENRH